MALAFASVLCISLPENILMEDTETHTEFSKNLLILYSIRKKSGGVMCEAKHSKLKNIIFIFRINFLLI